MLTGTALAADPLFDVHLHYNTADVKRLTPQHIVDILDRNTIRHALVTATPPQHAARLYRHAPDRILPLLGVYRERHDKESWTQDATLPGRLEQALENGPWRGIGELHVFANDRHSPIFERVVALARQHRLPLLLHADPAVIDRVYELAPAQPIIWAHAGTFPYPDLIADYLRRYPALYVDLSVRDARIAPEGTLRDDWYELLLRYPDRFMIGVDTYSPSRWDNFDSVVATTRRWLRQLPEDVADRVAYGNAAALFGVSETFNDESTNER